MALLLIGPKHGIPAGDNGDPRGCWHEDGLTLRSHPAGRSEVVETERGSRTHVGGRQIADVAGQACDFRADFCSQVC